MEESSEGQSPLGEGVTEGLDESLDGTFQYTPW
jgi:hypothetical protein